jgi:hypothetical protein
MPQLVKGGKHVYAWTKVSQTGIITVPPEAVKDYRLRPDELAVLFPGSKRSGGFSVIPQRNLKDSPLNPLKTDEVKENKVQGSKGRIFYVTRYKDEKTSLTGEALEAFEVKKGDRLLAVRGSGLGPSFLAKGPIKDESLKHPELAQY